jgi:UDP-3-O-[3-hydroxymyristoyl] glucosamine N-acyltransferase
MVAPHCLVDGFQKKNGEASMKIRLSEIPGIKLKSIVRDAVICSTGLLTGSGEKMLAALHDPAFLPDMVENEMINAIVTHPDLSVRVAENLGLITSDDPVSTFLDIHDALAKIDGFYYTRSETKKHPAADIHPTAWVGEHNVIISAGVVVGPNATILDHVSIGENSFIHAGAVVGNEGFHVETALGNPRQVTHTGSVVIGKDVEVQSNTNIARSIFGGATSIGDSTKIGGQCQIGHAVQIGQRCHIRPSTLISGSTVVGDDVWIAAGCRISNSVSLGNRSAVMFSETVTRDIPENMAFAKGRLHRKDRFLNMLKKIRTNRAANPF